MTKLIPSWFEAKQKPSVLRNKIEIERYNFIEKWCLERGLCNKIQENFNKGAIAWAAENCF